MVCLTVKNSGNVERRGSPSATKDRGDRIIIPHHRGRAERETRRKDKNETDTIRSTPTTFARRIAVPGLHPLPS